jgi:RimJ/RimL family protein N-acetyltransferase
MFPKIQKKPVMTLAYPIQTARLIIRPFEATDIDDIYEFHQIFGRCDARNVASYRLMERLGMRREAHLIHNELFKGEWSDELVYAILQNEWGNRIT